MTDANRDGGRKLGAAARWSPAVVGLAKVGGRFGPAKHLLNALTHPHTDRIAGMAGRSTIDGRSPIQDGGRLAWRSGPPGEPPRYTGLDVIIVRDEKIVALYVFLDAPPA